MFFQGKVVGLAAFAFVAATLTVHPVEAAAAANDTVVATVNGQKILKKDVEETIEEWKAMNALPPNANTVQVSNMVIQQLINDKLLDDAAKTAKIESSKEYKDRVSDLIEDQKRQLEMMKRQLPKTMYFEKILKNKVTNEKVKEAYDDFKKKNKGKIEMHARHILVPTEVEAKQVIKDLDKGGDFVSLAKSRSSGPGAQNGGDLGWFLKEDLGELSEAAFALKSGAYTKTPVKSDFGWHVIKAEEKRERSVPPLEGEVEMYIRNSLSQQEVAKVVTALREKAKIEIYGADGKKAATGKTGDAAKKMEAEEAGKKK